MTTESKPRIRKGWIWGSVAVVVVAVACIIAMAVECEKPVSREKLPVAAEAFLSEYYPDGNVAIVKWELDDLRVTYTVVFADGTHVVFRSNGDWKKIDSHMNLVPQGIVPAQISAYVNQTFPGASITGVEHGRRHYEVELDNMVELKFDDRSFVLTDYDD